MLISPMLFFPFSFCQVSDSRLTFLHEHLSIVMSLPLYRGAEEKIEANRQKALAQELRKTISRTASEKPAQSKQGPSKTSRDPSKSGSHGIFFKQQNPSSSHLMVTRGLKIPTVSPIASEQAKGMWQRSEEMPTARPSSRPPNQVTVTGSPSGAQSSRGPQPTAWGYELGQGHPQASHETRSTPFS